MKLKDLIPYVIIVILIVILFKTCDKKETIEEPVIIDIPIKPIEGISDTVYIDTSEAKIINLLNPVNTRLAQENAKLLENFIEADSLKKELQYLKAIQIKEYNQKFEDTFQTIEVYSKTRGELLAQSTKYLTKERTIRVDTFITRSKDKNFNIAIGGEVGIPLKLSEIKTIDNKEYLLNKPVIFKGNLIFKLNKFDISVGYDTNQNGWIGGNINIF